MARYTGPKTKISRIFGEPITGNGKWLTKNSNPPGMHGAARKRKSLGEYALQLREKQKAKRIAGLTEEQFHHYFVKAERLPGLTGENLLRLLETRLDNVTKRLGFALSMPHARQLVLHGHVQVNDQRVDVPSYPVQPGDKIALSEKARQNAAVQQALQVLQKRGPMPSWIEVNASHATGKVRSWPSRDEMSYPIDEQLIVELYSK